MEMLYICDCHRGLLFMQFPGRPNCTMLYHVLDTQVVSQVEVVEMFMPGLHQLQRCLKSSIWHWCVFRIQMAQVIEVSMRPFPVRYSSCFSSMCLCGVETRYRTVLYTVPYIGINYQNKDADNSIRKVVQSRD